MDTCAADYVFTVTNGTAVITAYTGQETAVAIPDTLNGVPVTRIAGWAFQFNHKLTSVIIPESVTSIGDWAFGGCDNLGFVKIGGGVTNIGSMALARCGSLKEIDVPASVRSIGQMAFAQCGRLESINVEVSNPNFSTVDGVLFDKSKATLLQFPSGKAGRYTVPEGVTFIEDWAFSYNQALTRVSLPGTIAALGYSPFFGCARLDTVIFSGDIAQLPDWTFHNCPNLCGVYFSGNAPFAGEFAFHGSTNVTVYYLPGAAGWGSKLANRPTSVWLPSSLQVTLVPADLATNGAKWQVDGGVWHDSGATVTNLPAGQHTICFSKVVGWTNPVCQTVTVSADRGAMEVVAYNPLPGRCALANVVATNGFVVAAKLVDAGEGYISPPPVYVVGGGGTGAVAVANVEGGAVRNIEILSAGAGYTNTPKMIIPPPYPTPIVLRLAPASWIAFSNLDPAGIYQMQTLIQGQWVNVQAGVNTETGDYATFVDGWTDTVNYRLVLTPVPTQAAALAWIMNGFFIGAQIADGGSGYTSTPAVRVVGGGGFGAEAAAVLTGDTITGIQVVNPGYGYTNSPSIEIDPPEVAGLPPIKSGAFKLQVSGMIPELVYRVDNSPDHNQWTEWESFSASNDVFSRYLRADASNAFFRVIQAP